MSNFLGGGGSSGGGSGTISSGTTNAVPKYTAATTVGSSLISDDGTTLTYTGTGGLSVSGTTTLTPTTAASGDVGSATIPFKDMYFAGASVTPGTNNFKITGTSTSGTRTFTFPDKSGTVATTSGTLTSGNCAKFDASGNLVDNGSTCGGGGSALGTHRVHANVSQALAAATTYYVQNVIGTNGASTSNAIPNPFTGTLTEWYCNLSISAGTGNAADTVTVAFDYDSAGNNGYATAAGSATSSNLSASGNFVKASATGLSVTLGKGKDLRLKITTPGAWTGTTPTLSNIMCQTVVTGAS